MATFGIVVENENQAALLVGCVKKELDRHGFVYLGQVKSLAGLPTTYNDYRRGWTSEIVISANAVEDGHHIEFPEPVALY